MRTKNKILRIIPGSVKTDRPPQGLRPPDANARKHPGTEYLDHADIRLTRIVPVRDDKYATRDQRCRPETDASDQQRGDDLGHAVHGVSGVFQVREYGQDQGDRLDYLQSEVKRRALSGPDAVRPDKEPSDFTGGQAPAIEASSQAHVESS